MNLTFLVYNYRIYVNNACFNERMLRLSWIARLTQSGKRLAKPLIKIS